MRLLSRRTAMASGLALSLGMAPASAPALGQPRKAFLSSDIGQLGRVLVKRMHADDIYLDRLSSALLPDAEADMAVAAQQQQAFFALLKEAGATPIELSDALAQAIAATRASGIFDAWLRATFPRLASDAADETADVTADVLLGRDRALRWQLSPEGDHAFRLNDALSTIWTRDSAFMTPQGLVICRSSSPRRLRENMLLRFIYRHAPMLADFPIVFDAVEEGVHLEGGDAIVLDPRTLLLGVGNRSDPRAAPLLARRLGMDVVAVTTHNRAFIRPSLPGQATDLFELRVLLLHLDTFFTLVGPGQVLAVPYLLEAAHADDNPLARFIRGARADAMLSESDAEKALDLLKDFGKVTLFRGGTGAREELADTKLVDWATRRRLRTIFVGGARPAGVQDGYAKFMEVSYPERRRQAANVVQARPGRVIAYAGNPATRAALAAEGIEVDMFEARELWAWHGGPHCLTQPLERS